MKVKFGLDFLGYLLIIQLLANCSLINNNIEHAHQSAPLSQMEISIAGPFHFMTDPDNTGILKSYHMPSFKDFSWKEINAPGSWESQGIIDPHTLTKDDPFPYSGHAWYRKWINLPQDWEGQDIELQLGRVCDAYICFWNGERIGERKKPAFDNTIPIPGKLARFNESNLLAIQVLDRWGEGGLLEGPLVLKPRFEWENVDLAINSRDKDFLYDSHFPILLDLNFHNPFDAPTDIILKIVIRDFNDLVVYKQQIDIRLNSHIPTNMIIDVPPLSPGHYRGDFDIYEKSFKLKSFQSSFAVIGAPIGFDDSSKSPFGLCGFDLIPNYEDPYMISNNRLSELMKITGINWLGIPFLWNKIEPVEGEWDFTVTDLMIENYTLTGISVLGNLSTTSDWIKGKSPRNEEDIRAFAEYSRIMASRYRNRIRFWEVWQKPGNPADLDFQPDAVSFVHLLKETYPAIKQSYPEAMVVGMAAPNMNMDFIKTALEMGAGNYLDIISIHLNQFLSPTNQTEDSDSNKIRGIRRIMDQYGCNKPIWITECGWQSLGSVSERIQAEYLVKFYITTLAQGVVNRIFWCNLRDDWEAPSERSGSFGLFHHDFTPKPSFAAYHTMMTILHDFTEIKSLDVGEGIFGFEAGFENHKRVRILWTEQDPQLISIPPESLVVDIVGKIYSETEGKILIDKTPRYIIEE